MKRRQITITKVMHSTIQGVVDAGIVFAQRPGSDSLTERCCKLALHYGASPDVITSAERFKPGVKGAAGAANDEGKRKALLAMAHAMGPSPAQVDSATIQQGEVLRPQEVIEVATFLGVLQLLHRLTVWRASI